jgi:hypothetical protein
VRVKKKKIGWDGWDACVTLAIELSSSLPYLKLRKIWYFLPRNIDKAN